jgi:hypothetical protein
MSHGTELKRLGAEVSVLAPTQLPRATRARHLGAMSHGARCVSSAVSHGADPQGPKLSLRHPEVQT